MPHIKMGSQHGVYVEIDADETAAALKALATEALKDACRILAGEPLPPAGSADTEMRYIPTHRDPNGRSDFGFAPPKAQGEA